MIVLSTFSMMAVIGLTTTASALAAATPPSARERLLIDVYSAQPTTSAPFNFFPPKLGSVAWLFDSTIHVNMFGPPSAALVRRDVGFPDNNMFVSVFALEALVEAHGLDPTVALNTSRLVPTLQTITGKNHDDYRPPTTPIFGFWPQESKANPTGIPRNPRPAAPFLQQWAINLSNGAYYWRQYAGNIAAFLDAVGLAALAKVVIPAVNQLVDFTLTVFNIPSDVDDTSTLLALAANLRWYGAPAAMSEPWAQHGYDVGAAYAAFAEAAYCPAGPFERNVIDPRSYFWARAFLNNLSDPDACIVTTWIESRADMLDRYGRGDPTRRFGPLMPFNVNNIDPSVAANAIFGMTAQLLDAYTCASPTLPAWFITPQFSKLYRTTARFVAWAVRQQPSQRRPGVETLYYPPIMNLMWFVARNIKHLRSKQAALHSQCGLDLPSDAAAVLADLAGAFSSSGVEYISARARSGPRCMAFGPPLAASGESAALLTAFGLPSPAALPVHDDAARLVRGPLRSEGMGNVSCWDDFLGQADTDAAGRPTPRYDDRYYTTAVAANALFDAFTIETRTPSGALRLAWVPETPATVMAQAQAASAFLEAALDAPDVSFMNAFFSGSVKAMDTLPFMFPGNHFEDMDTGATYTCSGLNSSLVGNTLLWAVSGTVPEPEYQAMLASGCGGMPPLPPPSPTDMNSAEFPFWSAPVLSKAFALLALTKQSVVTN